MTVDMELMSAGLTVYASPANQLGSGTLFIAQGRRGKGSKMIDSRLL